MEMTGSGNSAHLKGGIAAGTGPEIILTMQLHQRSQQFQHLAYFFVTQCFRACFNVWKNAEQRCW